MHRSENRLPKFWLYSSNFNFDNFDYDVAVIFNFDNFYYDITVIFNFDNFDYDVIIISNFFLF